jgi:hypothetical protein
VSNAVLDSVKGLPRRHLGHSYYDATLKRTGNSINGIRKGTQGYSSTPKPLPLFDEDQYNCTYTIKIPQINLTRASLQEITSRKALWGTDIYTDDSDVIAATIHAGWFRGAWDESIDTSLLGLELHGKALPKIKGPNGAGQILEQPPPEGPADVPANHDVHIDIVILPLLEGYSSTIRFGIKSREWGFKREGHKAQHDGLSFMIHRVSFITSDTSVAGIRTRKKIAQQKFSAARNIQERRLAEALKDSEPSAQTEPQFEESFERGRSGPMMYEDMRGIGTSSWWQPPKPKPPPPVRQVTPPVQSPSPVPPPSQEQTTVPEDDDFDPDTTIENNEDASAQPQQQELPQYQQQEAPRTPPRRSEPPRGYVPLDPPIPSPISVIDPAGDGDRTAEMSGGDSVDVTPVKGGTDTAGDRMEDVISPPRPVPDVASSPTREVETETKADDAVKATKEEMEQVREKEREVIRPEGGLGGNVEVRRESVGEAERPKQSELHAIASDTNEVGVNDAIPAPVAAENVSEVPASVVAPAENVTDDVAMEDARSVSAVVEAENDDKPVEKEKAEVGEAVPPNADAYSLPQNTEQSSMS